ncbi:hypothetical protein CYMTET_45059 [Cymbomonas tetramitiformis]|uniref:Glyoxalase/fosfomycin resistance/dioxygenase domain-containing protein n=1 Tax=Cymbomonas tetramitiformis TaxID=36881 RepID=A0AAE0C0T0_9CHLO|nr:hypothetical protein CYMTET_45059 [Cymbomonas tetramitiformis]
MGAALRCSKRKVEGISDQHQVNTERDKMQQGNLWESISAVTLGVDDMREAVKFYGKLGLHPSFGGADDLFTSLPLRQINGRAVEPTTYINLYEVEDKPDGVGRSIFYVSDVDAMYELALAEGLQPVFAPRDAAWAPTLEERDLRHTITSQKADRHQCVNLTFF